MQVNNIKYTGRRPFNLSAPVRVYWNLHRQCYSIQQDGYVVAYASGLTMRDCTMIVSQAGRNRVIRTGRKNVHAYIEGRIDWYGHLWAPVQRNWVTNEIVADLGLVASWIDRTGADRVSYNPYALAYWYAGPYRGDDSARVDSATCLLLSSIVKPCRSGLQERPYVVGHTFNQ